jgi:DNA-directed RNA polymerase II subunit RPB11
MNAPERYELLVLEDGERKVTAQRDTKIDDAAHFLIQKEDHTLGNLVRHQLLRDPEVLFGGYQVPHPLENFIVIKVQTTPKSTPENALKGALEDLNNELASIEQGFSDSLVLATQGADHY